MKNKIFLFFILFILFFSCTKKKELPKPTPTPTNTPVPKLEKIVYTYNGRLYWINLDGTGKQELFADNKSKWFPSVSPDGWYIAYWGSLNGEYNLYIGNLKNNKIMQLTYDNAPVDAEVNNFKIGSSISWDKNMKFLVYSRFFNIWKIDIDGFNQIALTDSNNCFSPSISVDDKLIYIKIENESDYNIYLSKLFYKTEQKLTNYTNKITGGLNFSTDGKKFVYTVIEEGNANIFLYDLLSNTQKQLTYDGKSFSPCFADNDKKILFSSNIVNKFQPEIWIMNLDGTEKMKITNDGGVNPSFLSRILSEPLPTPTPFIETKKIEKEESISEIIGIKEQPTLPYNLTPPAIETPYTMPTEVIVKTPEISEELKVKIIRKDNKLYFYPLIHFDSAYANIKSEFFPVLDDIALIIKKYKKSKILIEGHTDNDPISTKEYPSNLELSIARAKEVKKYLNSKHGIELKRILTKGFAETKPIVPNDTEENKYKNRRAEIIIILDKSEINLKIETPTPFPTDTPTLEPTPTLTATPTPKLNFFQKLFKPKEKPKKSKSW